MQSESASCICEYHDPSGVFPLLQQQLQSRFPLRNLHWKPSNRPLRSIDSLHVELVGAPENASSRPQSSHSASEQIPGGAVKERRHQIPGLRRTPYLKLYILRCDDVETYRETSRKAIREWFKLYTPPSQKTKSSAQEKHDAFEWMILHVVLPNTNAAGQARYSKASSKDEDAPPDKSGGSRLKLGRSSNTILEKIKADFNDSSKSAPDRVAQIRLLADDVPKAQMPAKPAVDNTYVETPQERTNAWNDVIAKFRTLILASFDLRVRQYEDDIRERGSQRTLPGWNFCTFFVLKEGLARGFESVGLLDDALLGYDELSVELDSIIREQGATAGFLAYTDELQQILDIASKGERPPQWSADNWPLSATRRPYRELILANQTSVFDFKSYIFARQLQILLRMAMIYQGPAPGEIEATSTPDDEDLGMLAELVRRATTFLTSVSLVLRQDLAEAIKENSMKVTQSIIDNIVASWTFAVCQQLIDDTRSANLSSRLASVDEGFQSFASSAKPKPVGLPARTSSLVAKSNNEPFYEQIPEDAKVIFDRLRLTHVKEPLSPSDHGPLEEFAGRRAELHLMQRSILERLVTRKGWKLGWKGLQSQLEDAALDTVDLEDSAAEDAPQNPSKESFDAKAVCADTLSDALASLEYCQSLYKELTYAAICHYLGARSPKAVERLMADLAVLRYEQGDFTGAANLFSKITPLFAEREWSMIEAQLLKLHADCLAKLNRRDDYVRMLLALAAKVVARRKVARRSHGFASNGFTLLGGNDLDDGNLISNIFAHSKDLPYEINVPMDTYFDDINVEPYIRHVADDDGFKIHLRFRNLFDQKFEVQTVKLLLKSLEGGPSQEFWIQNEGPITAKPGLITAVVSSQINSLAEFQLEKLVVVAHRIAFTLDDFRNPQELKQRNSSKDPGNQKPIILCYPRADAFSADVSLSRSFKFGKTRHLLLKCYNGRSAITNAQVRLRPATGGLRLRTLESVLMSGDVKFKVDADDVGNMDVLAIEPKSSFGLQFPFELPIESDIKEITLRLEITYHTSEGIFEFITTPSIKIALPLDVNVHDLFKSSALYSRFNVRTASDVPLEVLDVELKGNDTFLVEPPPCRVTPVTAFADQAIPVLFKVRQARGVDTSFSRQPVEKEESLNLTVTYSRIDEMAAEVVKQRFVAALTTSPVAELAKLLEFDMLSRFSERTSAKKYSEVALLREVEIPSYDTMGWDALLSLLSPQVYEPLRTWLQDWHKANTTIPLDDTMLAASKEKLVHNLIITVPVPRLHILNTATLSLPASATFINGRSIDAQLTISHTRRWESPNAFTVLPEPNQPIDFVLDLDAPTDTWLIGGMRRARFALKEGDVVDLPVVLLPLKEGRLALPTIEIKVASRELEELSCVTENRSMGDTVVVVGNVQVASVSLREGMAGTEVVLDEMIGRGIAV